jgi:WD40 repeat protein/DNA-binding SARP family transcriptional activator
MRSETRDRRRVSRSARRPTPRPARFRVLGPLEVSGEGGALPLGGPKQRTALAHLILNANQVVAAERLIDALWGEEPPDTARGTLQTYVSRLRSVLGSSAIEGRAPGYLLRVEPDEIDALRFERLLRDTRRSDGEPRAAAATLAEALDLWRGPALADLATEPSLAPEIARLEELRLQATEEALDIDLDLGRQTEAVAQLEALTREHPLRERLWDELMLALYRVDRQADALGAFERARAILADELGIDPSRELQELHARILRQDPDLDLKGEPLRGYRLLDQIGEGAFGVVYRATQPQIGREVAIKAVHPELANHPDFVRRFEREAQIVARLEHPHVVPLYDYWREPDAAYLVMRYLRGGSLEDLLADGPLEPARAASILDQMAAALSAAHRQGIVHRDVKPGNVLLDEEGNAYLTDFGVALDVGAPEKTSGTMMRGTPAYLSPEQIRLEPAVPASDVYALGVVLYEMLTGEHPFPASSLTALLDQHLRDPLPSLRQARPDLPVGVDDVIAKATAKVVEDRFADPLELALALRAVLEGTAAAHEPVLEIRNPYKGLRAFLEADARDFFGREAVTNRLLGRIGQDDEASRFLAVVGPSGSGKSSVVRAGLIPALRRGAIEGSERWFVIDVHPGSHPFRELESALLGVAVEPPPSLLEDLQRDALGLVRAADRVLPDPDAELLIVLDQLEEVFTLVTDEDERTLLLETLLAAALEPASRVRIVATLRADFFDAPLSVRGFGDLLAARTEAITPMSPEELERAIVAPADRAGLTVEPRLLAAMVADVVDRPGALPLLQYALTELAERRTDGILTLEGYRRIGGVSGALARRAEQLFGEMSDPEQEACRQLFLRLVTLGEGSEDTRRRVPRSELAPLADVRAMDGVIEAFGSPRLLSFDRDPTTREPTVEIAHEALLGAWTRLRGWISDARDDIRIERQLASAAGEWEAGNRDASFLLRGARLEQLADWADLTSLALTDVVVAYLDSSTRLSDQERDVEQSRAAKERTLERRSVRRLRGIVAALAVAALVAGVLTAVATGQSNRAEREARIAAARELAAASIASLEEDAELSVLLAIEAIETTRSQDGTVLPEAEEALHRAVQADRILLSFEAGGVVRFSPDGDRIFIPGNKPGTAEFLDAQTGEVLMTLRGQGVDGISQVSYSPDGRFVSTSSRSDASTDVWDAHTGDLLYRLTLPSGNPVCCWSEFSPDGSLLATNTWNHNDTRVWDLSTGKQINKFPPHDFVALGFAPDGQRLWTGRCVRDVLGHGNDGIDFCVGGQADITDVSWSPDGSRVATSSNDGTVVIRNGDTGDEEVTLSPGAAIGDIEVAPDGRRIALGLANGTMSLWNLTRTGAVEAFDVTAFESGIQSMKFSPDGARLVAGSGEGISKVLDVTSAGAGEGLTTKSSGAVAYSPKAGVLAVGKDNGRVQIFDTRTREVVRTMKGRSRSPVRDIAFDRSGATMATIQDDGTVTVADAVSGAPILPSWQDETGHHVALSPDGALIAVMSWWSGTGIWDSSTGEPVERIPSATGAMAFNNDGSLFAATVNPGLQVGNETIDVWDVDSWAKVEELPHSDDSNALAFSADGTHLYSGGLNGVPEGWDVATWRKLPDFGGNSGRIWGVATDMDGIRLATASARGAYLWDPVAGRALFRVTTIPNTFEERITMSSDGSQLVARSQDGTVSVYLLDIDELLTLAHARVARGLTDEECRQYVPFSQTCSSS